MHTIEAINQLAKKQDLSSALMEKVMLEVLQNQVEAAPLAAWLMGLALKGESATEIISAVQIMRKMMCTVKIPMEPLVDIVGTGGDQAKLFNVSTAACFVAAAAGAYVVKHGGGAVSSMSGSADFYKAMDLPDFDFSEILQCIQTHHLVFLPAAKFHPALKHVNPIRKQLRIRTLFNLIGPLCNPASPQRLVLGVSEKRLLPIMAEVIVHLGYEKALIIFGKEGIDEISIAGPTDVIEINQQTISVYEIAPEDFGIKRADLKSSRVANAQQSAHLVSDILKATPSSSADMVALNAGAALYVTNCTKTLQEGVELAKQMLINKMGWKKLQAIKNYSIKETN